VAVLAVLAIAVSLFIRWLGGAKALGSGIGYGLGGPARVGETVYSGPMVFSASGSVTMVDIRSIIPRVIHDSAGARIRTLVCGYRQGIRHGSATSGMELQLWTGKTDPFDN
jgi:hypothetical protein